jgi:tRNA pseudouridine32 synthase/23S rRNA pseudouridine746 synthase/23S rRNA pseudouridine1911/1915/1917 synthase
MINIIYEDDYIVAVNKPAGILVTPNKPNERNLTDMLSEHFAARGDKYKAHPCHRLDKETSGAILFAKGKKIQKVMMETFAQSRIKKYYIALIRDCLPEPEGIIERAIDGKPAKTEYHLIAKRDGYSILYIRLHTGRTNQIRIHFAMLGHPLLGETKFAFRRDFKVKFGRCALHCETLEFESPLDNKQITITADVPDDIKKMM